MNTKFWMQHDKWAYVVEMINDQVVHIAAKILAMKVVRKNWPNQCTSGVIVCAEHYI